MFSILTLHVVKKNTSDMSILTQYTTAFNKKEDKIEKCRKIVDLCGRKQKEADPRIRLP
jgi:hypothetical protein